MREGAADATVAFFDVDETLLSGRTLESFLMYYLKQEPSMASTERLRELRNDVVRLSRVAFNREYFGLWAGQSAARVLAAGRTWFRDAVDQPGFFRTNVLERLREHRKNGAHIVLISGSFAAPLQPIAEYVDAHGLYCTELEVSDSGFFTGSISSAMLGDDKRRAIEDYLAKFSPQPVSTWGYGDHVSDLPLLVRVSNPVVVGTDAALNLIAAERNWQVLPIGQSLAPRSPKG